jgi:hypothetical protein
MRTLMILPWVALLACACDNPLGNGDTTIDPRYGEHTLMKNKDRNPEPTIDVPMIGFADPGQVHVSIGESFELNPSVVDDQGATITDCTSSPELPDGVSVSASTCVISGTPTVSSLGEYSITAVNQVGSSEPVNIVITVGPFASGGDEVYAFVGDGINGDIGQRYFVHKFTTPGAASFEPILGMDLEFLLVAGGGGGGSRGGRAGGGGAGGLRKFIENEEANSEGDMSRVYANIVYPIVVGSGGAGGGTASPRAGANGSNSSALGLSASGGGGGGAAGADPADAKGKNGGSGGGGGAWSGGYAGSIGLAVGSPSQGNNGGDGIRFTVANGAGGGGGGAGGQGTDAVSGAKGLGGPGLLSFITGQSEIYSRGGNGGYSSDDDTNMEGLKPANTGNGGDGTTGPTTKSGGTGASGVVVLRYKQRLWP